MNSKSIQSIIKFIIKFRKPLENCGLCMRNFCNWSQSYKNTNFILKISFSVSKTIKHLGCSLWMAYICNFLMTGLSCDIVKGCWKIIKTHVCPIKVPKLLFILPWIIFSICATISISSWISKPNIISRTCGNKCRRNICVVHDPTVCRVK